MANIIVTGANRGIGYFMAERLLENGHVVAAFDLEIDRLDSLKAVYGDRLLPLVCDLRDTARVTACVQETAEALGSIATVVHNACVCTFASMDDTDEETYREVLNVNYFGAVRLTKAVLPYLRKQKEGKVIYVSSGVGVMGFFNISPYASSKGALESLAKCLDLENRKRGITFHIMHPPITRTKSSDPFPLPTAFKADPKVVGYGLADRIGSKRFVICHSPGQAVQTKLCYLFPIRMGRFLSDKMTKQFSEEPSTL